MRLGVRQRHHHVAAQEPDRVLHAALLVARARIADTRPRSGDAKRNAETPPPPRSCPTRPGAPRRWRRPGTSTGGTAPMCSNTPSSPTAHALRVLPGQRHRVPHVRIRERRHQAVHVRPAPRNHGLSQTEIRLHHARRPLQPPDTRHREADAPASSASHNAARSGTNHRTPAPRPACHTHAWPYAAAYVA